MSTIIRSDLFDKGLVAKESYETIKKRLFQAGDFIEVTGPKTKETLNKGVIKSAAPILAEKKIKQVQVVREKPIEKEVKEHGRSKNMGEK